MRARPLSRAGQGEEIPFRLVSASLSTSAPRHSVDEWLASGYLDGGDLSSTERNYASYSASDAGAAAFLVGD
jgi:hypothetical protein